MSKLQDESGTEFEMISVPLVEQVAAFVGVLFEPADTVEIRSITRESKTGPVSQWLSAKDVAQSPLKGVMLMSAAGADIYIGANPRIARGMRGDDAVALARVVFVDADNCDDIPKFLEGVTQSGLPAPTVVVLSGHGAHAYWRLSEAVTDMTAWREIQRGLAVKLGTDTSVHNPERIMRLPGFVNWKPPAAESYLWFINPELRYAVETFAHLRELSKIPTASKSKAPVRVPQIASGEAISSSSLMKRASAYAANAENSAEGGRNGAAFRLAGGIAAIQDAHGTRLSDADILNLVAGWNLRNVPPLDDAELKTAVGSALKNGTPREAKVDRPPSVQPAEEFGAIADEPEITALGERDPNTGRVVLSSKRTVPTAKAFIKEFHQHKEGRTIHNYADAVFVWIGDKWVSYSEAAIDAKLHPWLDKALRYVKNPKTQELELVNYESNPGTVTSAREAVKMESYVHNDVPYHSWFPPLPEDVPAGDVISCKSSLLYIPCFATIPHTPRLFNIASVACDFDRKAPQPAAWLEFLAQVFPNDPASIRLLQTWFGYCITGDTSHQKMMLMVGARRSGKGTIARILTSVVGTGNVAGPTTSSLAGPFGLQQLIGKSVAIVSDARFAGDTAPTAVERLLCISGEDILSIDRKHISSVTMKLPTRFTFLSNELPKLTDSSGALAGRFLILRFAESFYGREDLTLTEKLRAELPGILNWALEGWNVLRTDGKFVEPPSSKDIRDDMEDLLSPVGSFVRERCTVGANCKCWLADLFSAWQSWCNEQGWDRVSTIQVFSRDLSAAVAGVRVKRTNSRGRSVEGIQLR